MNKEKLLEDFRQQCQQNLDEVKDKFPSQEFVKGVKRGLVGAA